VFGTTPVFPSSAQPPNISHTHGPMVGIDSADATTIVDSSSQALLDELNTKKQRWRIWPSIAVLSTVVFLIAAANGAQNWGLLLLAILGAGAIVAAHLKDQLRKTVVLMYELDEPMEKALETLHAGANSLASASATWHVSPTRGYSTGNTMPAPEPSSNASQRDSSQRRHRLCKPTSKQLQ